MDQVVVDFVTLLKQRNIEKLVTFFQDQSDAFQTKILLFLALQGIKDSDSFDYFQLLCTKLCASNAMPTTLVSQIKNLDLLTFFTPLLQTMANFALQDNKGRNVLHYMCVARGEKQSVPFNYLRSLLLFESNLFLPKALTQTESNNLTPIECYLHLNIQGTTLPNHEFTALIALMEIEQSQRNIEYSHLNTALSRFKKQTTEFTLSQEYKTQKSLLLASYYGISVKDINANLTSNN